ncbi:MAG: cyanophycinase [Polyangiaceae bacterium]|nr:cyanophycinase [Polyangiaceae bacterium]
MSAKESPEALSGPASSKSAAPLSRGPLIAIGGAEDKVGDRAILRLVVERAGGKGAKIAIFPTASSIPNEMAPLYEKIFRSFGAHAETVWVDQRSDAEDPKKLAQVRDATAIFFTGGAQGRIVTLIGGTPMAQAVRRAHRAGVVVAGTSAGASVICDHMIAQGKKAYAPRRSNITMAPGLGLTKRLVIDQHFAQRHRIGRLFTAVALNPFLLGVGIDEDTAIVLEPTHQMHVFGAGTVTVIDGAKILYTDIHETPTEGEPAALLGVQVHVLTHACTFDIDARRPTWPPPPTHPDHCPRPARRRSRKAAAPAASAPSEEEET